MKASVLLAALAALAAASCTSTSQDSEGGGSTLRNLFFYGGTTVPPAAKRPTIEAVECPPVTVAEGGSAYRVGGGEGGAPRLQISISEVARECIERDDGAIVVKVGVEARALLGAGGAAGRYEAPLVIYIKRGDQVLSSRQRRIAVAIPAGQASGSVAVVEEGLVVPPGTGEFDIEISLSGGAPARAARSARRR